LKRLQVSPAPRKKKEDRSRSGKESWLSSGVLGEGGEEERKGAVSTSLFPMWGERKKKGGGNPPLSLKGSGRVSIVDNVWTEKTEQPGGLWLTREGGHRLPPRGKKRRGRFAWTARTKGGQSGTG